MGKKWDVTEAESLPVPLGKEEQGGDRMTQCGLGWCKCCSSRLRDAERPRCQLPTYNQDRDTASLGGKPEVIGSAQPQLLCCVSRCAGRPAATVPTLGVGEGSGAVLSGIANGPRGHHKIQKRKKHDQHSL